MNGVGANVNDDESNLSVLHLAGLFVIAAAFVTAGIYMPQIMWVSFYEEYLQPLRAGAPIVRVDYANFAAAGMAWLALGTPFLAVVAVIHQYRGFSDRARTFIGKGFSYWGLVGVVLLILVPASGGFVAGQVVKSEEGYRYCDRLLEVGFIRYETVYVRDPRLCVSPYALDEVLERYGYATR